MIPGVKVVEGDVIGICLVVVRDIEPWMVVVGNPAVVVKKGIQEVQ